MIGIMSAAHAAITPGSESSSTTHRAAATPRRLAASRKVSGAGLARLDFIATDQHRETMHKASILQFSARAFAPRRCGDRCGDHAFFQEIEQHVDARLQADAFVGDYRVVARAPRLREAFDRVIVTVACANESAAITKVAADHLSAQSQVEFDRELARGVLPCAQGDRLGVEQQTVHVEDYGANGDAAETERQRMRPRLTR